MLILHTIPMLTRLYTSFTLLCRLIRDCSSCSGLETLTPESHHIRTPYIALLLLHVAVLQNTCHQTGQKLGSFVGQDPPSKEVHSEWSLQGLFVRALLAYSILGFPFHLQFNCQLHFRFDSHFRTRSPAHRHVCMHVYIYIYLSLCTYTPIWLYDYMGLAQAPHKLQSILHAYFSGYGTVLETIPNYKKDPDVHY